MRKQIAAANWKMNLSLAEGLKLINQVIEKNIKLYENQEAVFAVPFPYLIPVADTLKSLANGFTSAQNCSSDNNGAFTGEVSAQMLASIGTTYVIIGHSERRGYNHETNDILAQKIDRAFENDLKPIFCCGEPLNIREASTQAGYVETQLKESLFHLSAEQLQNFVIAYEPIWAIGTGKTASSVQAQEMHAHIRKVMEQRFGKEVANSISILYGGSVKAANAKEIFSQIDVDGGLVGGASLIADEFAVIMQSLKTN
ncbi:MAG: triose-phosphate isomerase [Ferruginibacter sp.]